MDRRVVITGLGVITPIGIGKESFCKSLLKGKNGVCEITKFDTSDFTVKIAAEVKDFDPLKALSPKKARRMDRFSQFAVLSSLEAWSDSGLDIERENNSRIGVIIGSGIGGIETWEEQYKRLIASPRRVSPFFIPMMIMNTASSEVSIALGAKGPNFGIVSACATSAHSVGEAYRIIQRGDADIMVTGGTESAITPLAIAGFSNMRALSTRNDEPERASRPFDRDRDGFVVGEGAGILILEEMEHAKKRRAFIYSEIAGYGATCDAYHVTAPSPDGKDAARAIKIALSEANLSRVDYINAHGTSTPLNDKTETLGVKLAFGEEAKRIPISATKSMIGHLLGAAGACELIACCLAMRDGIIHPTRNLENPDPECDLDYVPKEARKLDVRTCLSNSFGFGGHNASIVLKKFEG
jgi:3-oxoacyl-[acyl-carrier-protein] synthase II